MKRTYFLSLLPLMGLVVACSSIEDKTLSEVTRDELIELCEDNLDLFSQGFDEGLARASCVLVLDQTEMCTAEALQSCVDDRRDAVDPELDDVDCSQTDETVVEGCDATVGEYLDCLDAIVDVYDGYKTLECGQSDQVITAPPTACSALQQQCPRLFGAEDG